MTGPCLVIMRFAVREADRHHYPESHWKEVYGGLFRPATERAGLKCRRDDDDFAPRPISYVIAVDELTTPPFDVADFNRFHYDRALRPLALRDQIARLAKMLRAILEDPNGRCSIVQSLRLSSPRAAKRIRPKCAVDIYRHEQGFTWKEASHVAQTPQHRGVVCRLMEHSGPGVPDAVFIGALVEAEDARFVMGLVPYEVKFLFRPDYPESEGGDSSGYKIGIGYSSRYNETLRSERAEPIAVSSVQLVWMMFL